MQPHSSRHDGVVTIAGRFDVVLHIAAPDESGRARILRRYTRDLGCEVDVDRVAAATAGRSGADLRELVTRAVLHAHGVSRGGEDVAITTDLIVDLAREMSASGEPGQYL